MKSKHVGMVGVVIAATALLAVAAQLLWASWHQVRPHALGGALDSYSSARLMVDATAVSRMDLVEPTLSKLVKPETAGGQGLIGTASEVNYAMLGKRPIVVPVVKEVPPPAPKVAQPHAYRVAMTYISGDHRYAVVDRKLYRQGARLPNGENLAEISASAVRIDSVAGERWISIHSAGRSEQPPATLQ